MKHISHLLILLALFVGAAATPGFAGNTDPLFINLTSDDPHRANMAISFGGNQQKLGHPLTIFLNDKGVRLGSTANSDTFADHQKKLGELISQGATVLICQMCMKHYGFGEADLIPGLELGKPDLTGEMLFKDNTKTLTW
jgi:sulfur relay (sulfurtransferase) complex TusBCD TusD component (DsrE family)